LVVNVLSRCLHRGLVRQPHEWAVLAIGPTHPRQGMVMLCYRGHLTKVFRSSRGGGGAGAGAGRFATLSSMGGGGGNGPPPPDDDDDDDDDDENKGAESWFAGGERRCGSIYLKCILLLTLS
jgi:hypothetical protein